MKKAILLAAVAILSVTSAQASIDCEWLGRTSKLIMEARQHEAPMTNLLKVADRYPTVGPLLKSVVNGAYAHPLYKSEAAKKNAANEFSDQHLKMCLDMNKPKK